MQGFHCPVEIRPESDDEWRDGAQGQNAARHGGIKAGLNPVVGSFRQNHIDAHRPRAGKGHGLEELPDLAMHGRNGHGEGPETCIIDADDYDIAVRPGREISFGKEIKLPVQPVQFKTRRKARAEYEDEYRYD
jgi:hypothetical protein